MAPLWVVLGFDARLAGVRQYGGVSVAAANLRARGFCRELEFQLVASHL